MSYFPQVGQYPSYFKNNHLLEKNELAFPSIPSKTQPISESKCNQDMVIRSTTVARSWPKIGIECIYDRIFWKKWYLKKNPTDAFVTTTTSIWWFTHLINSSKIRHLPNTIHWIRLFIFSIFLEFFSQKYLKNCKLKSVLLRVLSHPKYKISIVL